MPLRQPPIDSVCAHDPAAGILTVVFDAHEPSDVALVADDCLYRLRGSLEQLMALVLVLRHAARALRTGKALAPWRCRAAATSCAAYRWVRRMRCIRQGCNCGVVAARGCRERQR